MFFGPFHSQTPKPRRHLLVVAAHIYSPEQCEATVHQLEQMLVQVETYLATASASEVADLQRYRLIGHNQKIRRMLAEGSIDKPFRFLLNKN